MGQRGWVREGGEPVWVRVVNQGGEPGWISEGRLGMVVNPGGSGSVVNPGGEPGR